MLFGLIVVITSLVGILFYVAWIDSELYNMPRIPETELEKNVREIKLRIADAEWKFKREIGEI